MWDLIQVSYARGGVVCPGDKGTWRDSRERLEGCGNRDFMCLEERERSRGGWC